MTQATESSLSKNMNDNEISKVAYKEIIALYIISTKSVHMAQKWRTKFIKAQKITHTKVPELNVVFCLIF